MRRNRPESVRSAGSSSSSSGTWQAPHAGTALDTSCSSVGLSSMKTRLSTPMFSSAAIAAMLSDFGCQLTRQDRDVVEREHHALVALEHVEDLGLVVLARNRQHDAARLEHLQVVLKGLERAPGKGVAELEAAESVLADDPAPQRVVAIEHDAFRRSGRPFGDRLADLRSEQQPEVALVGLAVHRPFLRVEDLRLARRGAGARRGSASRPSTRSRARRARST